MPNWRLSWRVFWRMVSNARFASSSVPSPKAELQAGVASS